MEPNISSVFLVLFLLFLTIIISLLITSILFYLITVFIRMKKREKMSLEMVTMEVRMPKENEIKIDAAEQFFASFAAMEKSGRFSFFAVDDVIAFEIIAKRAEIKFYVSAPGSLKDYVEKQIYAYYPQADIRTVEEPNIFTDEGKVAFSRLILKHISYYPIKTYRELPTDSISAVTSALSRMGENEGALIQILIRASDNKWKKTGKSYVSSTKKAESTPDKATFKVDPKVLEKIDEKTNRPGYETEIRIVVTSKTKEMANLHLKNIKSTFSQFNSDLNSLSAKVPRFKYFFYD